MLVSLTVGKVDAGVTVLLTPDKRLVRLEHWLSRGSLLIATSTDRIPVDPSPSRHLVRLHR